MKPSNKEINHHLVDISSAVTARFQSECGSYMSHAEAKEPLNRVGDR
jgi:hypothetical protein